MKEMSFPEMMFYAEAEGYISTRLGKLNRTISDVKLYPTDQIDLDTLDLILQSNGLSYSELTLDEINYIKQKIRD